MSDFNATIIEEFRAHEGVVGGRYEGSPLLLLHTIGAKSGEPRIHPLAYQVDGDRLVVFASNGGGDRHSNWFYNLEAHPEATVEIGTETRSVVARVAEGEERERLFEIQKRERPVFASHEEHAGDRLIPVVVLEPAT